MEKPDGDGYLHADDKEQGVSLRPPDELQLANMNEPEKLQQELDARTKKCKTRENGGRDPADDEPDGGGYFQADTNEKGVPLRPPHEFKLTDMNEPERHELDAGTKKRKTREAGGDWAEEQQEDRERKMMLQGNEEASAEEVVDLMEDLGMELQAEEAEPVEEAVDLMEDLGMELQAEEAEPEEEAIDVIEEDLALHRRQQGIGATVQYLRDTEADWSLDQQVQVAAGTSEAPRNLAPISGCSINALPLAILEDILMRINSASIRNAVSSSFVFVRAAMTLCKCDAFRDNGSFIAAIVQPSYGRPSVTAPERQRHHPLSSAANMLDRFLTLRYNALHWYRIIDSRKGYLLIQRNHSANQFDVMRPFLTMRVVTLPLIDLRQQEELVTAAIVPEASPRFVVMMLSREGLDVTLREFRSRQGIWIQQRVQCSLVFPALPESRRQPLYASDKLYLLDAPKQRVLCFSREQNLLDSIRLPASVDGACVKTSTLSRTRDGQVCWAALDHSGVTIFALDGVSWRKKRRWPVPQHFYSSRLIGFAEDSEQVMVGCFEEVCCIDIEEGITTYLKEAPAADSCVAFEVDHVVVDHE